MAVQSPLTDPPGHGADLGRRVGNSLALGLSIAVALTASLLYFVLYSAACAPLCAGFLSLGSGSDSVSTLGQVAVLFVLPALACFGLFWVILKIQLAIMFRPLARQRMEEAMEQGLQIAQRQTAASNEQYLQNMKLQGSTEDEIAAIRQTMEVVQRKVAADAERRMAEYRKNPALLEREIRGMVEHLQRGPATQP